MFSFVFRGLSVFYDGYDDNEVPFIDSEAARFKQDLYQLDSSEGRESSRVSAPPPRVDKVNENL